MKSGLFVHIQNAKKSDDQIVYHEDDRMPARQKHQLEVCNFLQKHFSSHDWNFSLPSGSGMETYFAQGAEQSFFVKVGASVERYLVMSEMGLSPPILALGELESGLPILVQPRVAGKRPSQKDFREQLEKVAIVIHKMHNAPPVQNLLKPVSSERHEEMGLQSMKQLRQKWERYRVQVPDVAEFVENSLEDLTQQIHFFSTSGEVGSHNDICNANLLFAFDGTTYVLDFEAMSLEDPALDLGALLWWYYPPELRKQFLEIAGYSYDEELRSRMWIRMAMHCLNITLPREQSFDDFDPSHYSESLNDFRAILAHQENPQGYS
jgi:phosphotransferase family enzyme